MHIILLPGIFNTDCQSHFIRSQFFGTLSKPVNILLSFMGTGIQNDSKFNCKTKNY